jgi:hypothetical protein
MSADGTTAAVGASFEYGDGSSPSDDSAMNAGAVYVFTRTGGTWTPQAYLKASHVDFADMFGSSVSLSGDGNLLAVGAKGEASCANTIDGSQTDNGCQNAGAVYLFARSGSTWTQQTYIKPSNGNITGGHSFGNPAVLSLDGNTLAVGAVEDRSNAKGIDGDQTDISAELAGAVFVFVHSSTGWTQQGYIKGSNTGQYDLFGAAVALSSNGSVMAVGAPGEDSDAVGVGGNETIDYLRDAGAVYTFKRVGSTWSQTAYVKASNTGQDDTFGATVALSAGGTTLAVGAPAEQSGSTGVDGPQLDDSSYLAGAVYVFGAANGSWLQQAYIKPGLPPSQSMFGYSLSLAGNGFTLAVGAMRETSGGAGLVTPTTAGAVASSGAVYTYRRSGNSWAPHQAFKASAPGADDQFGSSVALSADTTTLAVGAFGEDSNAVDVGGDQSNNGAGQAGAVYFIR